jgi:hypothetical protein
MLTSPSFFMAQLQRLNVPCVSDHPYAHYDYQLPVLKGMYGEKCNAYFGDRKPSFRGSLMEFILGYLYRAGMRTPKKAKGYASPLTPAANDTVQLPIAPDTYDKLPLLNLVILLTVLSTHAPNFDVWDYQFRAGCIQHRPGVHCPTDVGNTPKSVTSHQRDCQPFI